MPFKIIRNDITKVKADAIVNTANPKPCVGSGTDRAIYAAAGREELLAERKKIGNIAPGQAFGTDAFNLDAKYIIHTVGPAWIDGTRGERDTLHSCYANSLSLAAELKCDSIAFSPSSRFSESRHLAVICRLANDRFFFFAEYNKAIKWYKSTVS